MALAKWLHGPSSGARVFRRRKHGQHQQAEHECGNKTLSENGNPKLRTLVSVLHGVGLRLSFEPEKKRNAATQK